MELIRRDLRAGVVWLIRLGCGHMVLARKMSSEFVSSGSTANRSRLAVVSGCGLCGAADQCLRSRPAQSARQRPPGKGMGLAQIDEPLRHDDLQSLNKAGLGCVKDLGQFLRLLIKRRSLLADGR